MSYISDIQKVTQKSHLSFSELTNTIVALYGEDDIDGTTTTEGSKNANNLIFTFRMMVQL